MDLGQLSSAEEKMQGYPKLKPRDASAHYGMGRIFQLGMQLEKARAEFQHSIELQPVQTEADYQLGDIALGQGDFDNAIAFFDKTLARDPKHGDALAGTVQAYFKQSVTRRPKIFLSEPSQPRPITRQVITIWALRWPAWDERKTLNANWN
jgi:tetratricopeptide (TPR) repeat protein